MKKVIYLLSLSAIISLSGFSQTEKGYIMVGADLGGLHANDHGFEFSLNPNIAWFVKKDLALGGSVTLGYLKPKDVDGAFVYGLSPLARLYFAGSEKNRFFGQLSAGVGGWTNGGGSFWHVSPRVGYNHFIITNVALELSGGYTYQKQQDFDGEGELGINFGLQIFLAGKKAGK